MLKSLNLQPVYDSSENDLIQDLIVPLLSNSQEYLRGVGFFTSGWLRITSEGIVNLIENGGKAKFVVSPVLDEQDWEALQLGEEAKIIYGLSRFLRKTFGIWQNLLKKIHLILWRGWWLMEC